MKEYSRTSLNQESTKDSTRPAIEPIVGLKAKVKKPSFFEDLFNVAKDGFKTAIKDIAIPALQKTIVSGAYYLVDILVYREPQGNYRDPRGNYNYGSSYKSSLPQTSNGYWVSQGSRKDYSYNSNQYDYMNNIFEINTGSDNPKDNETAAYIALAKMKEIIDFGDGRGHGHYIRVAEAKELLNLQDTITTSDWNYIWTDLRSARVERSRVGTSYLLYLPQPMAREN